MLCIHTTLGLPAASYLEEALALIDAVVLEPQDQRPPRTVHPTAHLPTRHTTHTDHAGKDSTRGVLYLMSALVGRLDSGVMTKGLHAGGSPSCWHSSVCLIVARARARCAGRYPSIAAWLSLPDPVSRSWLAGCLPVLAGASMVGTHP